jgi:death-on-curing protein
VGRPEAPLVYLELEDVLELYAAIIGGSATQAADHLRNRPGLEGAIARPATHAHYRAADIVDQAAVLAHGIAETQPFVDGNKRVALIAMLTFLEVNGLRIDATDAELAAWIIELSAEGTEATLADRLRPRVTPSS